MGRSRPTHLALTQAFLSIISLRKVVLQKRKRRRGEDKNQGKGEGIKSELGLLTGPTTVITLPHNQTINYLFEAPPFNMVALEIAFLAQTLRRSRYSRMVFQVGDNMEELNLVKTSLIRNRK